MSNYLNVWDNDFESWSAEEQNAGVFLKVYYDLEKLSDKLSAHVTNNCWDAIIVLTIYASWLNS